MYCENLLFNQSQMYEYMGLYVHVHVWALSE